LATQTDDEEQAFSRKIGTDELDNVLIRRYMAKVGEVVGVIKACRFTIGRDLTIRQIPGLSAVLLIETLISKSLRSSDQLVNNTAEQIDAQLYQKRRRSGADLTMGPFQT
jgi:hypothetical protein